MTEDEIFEGEWQKMLDGQVYAAGMPQFLDKLIETREKVRDYNDLRPSDTAALNASLRALLGSCGDNVVVNQPFRCDFGENIRIGDNVVVNFNCTVLDEARVTIGNRVLIGPNVSIYTACHPIDAAERSTFDEWAEPVTIGDDVWIGGSATILPGVTIGERSIVGAGSVVTKDVPSDVAVAGNPAKIIKKLK